MPFIDTHTLAVGERLPGWKSRTFDSENMTFAHFAFEEGASIHEHWHPNEEVWHLIEGRLEVTIGTCVQFAGPGFVAVVPPNAPHSVCALSSGKAIVVDHPIRRFETNVRRAAITVGFEQPVAIPQEPDGGSIVIPFVLRNWAEMPALVKAFSVETGIAPSLPPPIAPEVPAGDLPTSRTVRPSESWAVSAEHRGFGSKDRERIRNGAAIFCVHGFILYDDSLGNRYRTAFCRVYNSDRFNHLGGFLSPDRRGYNYAT